MSQIYNLSVPSASITCPLNYIRDGSKILVRPSYRKGVIHTCSGVYSESIAIRLESIILFVGYLIRVFITLYMVTTFGRFRKHSSSHKIAYRHDYVCYGFLLRQELALVLIECLGLLVSILDSGVNRTAIG